MWWPKILDARFGDLWTVKRTLPGGVGTVTRPAFVVGVSHSSGTDRDWSVVVKLQDATAWQGGSGTPRFLILDNATYGKLDTGKLAAV